MNIRDIRQQLRQFFEGKSSGKGGRLVDDWYHFFDDRPEDLQHLDDGQKEELRKEIFAKVRKSSRIPGNVWQWDGHNNRSTGRGAWPYKLAAGFAVLLLAVIPVFLFTAEPQISETVEYKTSSNPAGQSSRLRLTDGTSVWLSANSTLRYPEHFEGGAETREVTLEGEAFFDVAPDPDKPFIVHSENLRTRVLGTSFNVRAFEEDEDIAITVTTGRVSVEQDNPGDTAETDGPALLYPEQQLLYNYQTRTTETREVDSRVFTSWKDGLLMFENHTFEEITNRLERWYGVDIRFADEELKKMRFRVLFENTSLEYALNMLQTIRDFKFQIEDQKVWINSR